MKRMDGWARRTGEKKKKECKKVVGVEKKWENRQDQADADTRCSHPISSSSSSFQFLPGEWKWTRRVDNHRVPAAPLPLYLSLCSPLLSHPIPLSFIPPSVSTGLSTLLSSSLFHCLPPSISFHVVTHYSADISTSVHLSDSLSPAGDGLHPPCLRTGRDRREGGGHSRWIDSEFQRRDKRWWCEKWRLW